MAASESASSASELGLRARKLIPSRSIFGSAARLLGTGVDIPAPGDFEFNETCGQDGQRELSFQESTRNSTGPEVDLLASAFWHRMLDQNVADL